MATKEKVECGCGVMIVQASHVMHERGKAHQAWAHEQSSLTEFDPVPLAAILYETASVAPEPVLHPDLQSVLDDYKIGPIYQAKKTRQIFSVHGWPNESQPLTVREFLVQNNIPVMDTPEGFTDGQVRAYRLQQERELVNG